MNEELTFEEIFKPLIDECRKIDIEYDYKMYGFQDDGYAVYEIVRINGEYPFKFRKRVLELGKEGIESLRKELNRISYEGRVDFLEDIKAEVLSLGSIVRDDEIVYEETADSHRKEVQFKSFKTANLIAVSDERNRGHELSILYKEKPTHKKYTLSSRYKPAHDAKLAREYFLTRNQKILWFCRTFEYVN
jgi:hypothetical protein